MSKTEKDATRANELERQIEKCALEFTGYSRDELYESFKAGSVNQHHIAFEAGKKAGRSEAIEEALKEVRHYKGLFEYPEDYTELIKELEKIRTTTI